MTPLAGLWSHLMCRFLKDGSPGSRGGGRADFAQLQLQNCNAEQCKAGVQQAIE